MHTRVQVAVRIRPPREQAQPAATSPVSRARRGSTNSQAATGNSSSRPSSAASNYGGRLISVENSNTIRVLSKAESFLQPPTTFLGASPVNSNDRLSRYQYDHVFNENSQQDAIYSSAIQPIVESFLSGYNCTVMAYGQTASGKTYTMGTEATTGEDDTAGIIPRALSDIFASLAGKAYEANLSMIEIYNEDIYDLLKPPTSGSSSPTAQARGNSVTLREDAAGMAKVVGATETVVSSSEECLALLQRGLATRSTGMTAMNQRSSRSHAIVTLSLVQHLDNSTVATCLSSRFHFVDLAGSERVNKLATTGDRRREGISINQGLLALGQVIHALSEPGSGQQPPQPQHVPYRESKLTRVLQSALGGNSRTLMVTCISAEDSDYSESVSSLRYAARARAIRNSAVANIQIDPAADMVAAALAKENAELKALVVQLQAQAAMGPLKITALNNPLPPTKEAQALPEDTFFADYARLCQRVSKFRSHLGSVRASVHVPVTAWGTPT